MLYLLIIFIMDELSQLNILADESNDALFKLFIPQI